MVERLKAMVCKTIRYNLTLVQIQLCAQETEVLIPLIRTVRYGGLSEVIGWYTRISWRLNGEGEMHSSS